MQIKSMINKSIIILNKDRITHSSVYNHIKSLKWKENPVIPILSLFKTLVSH